LELTSNRTLRKSPEEGRPELRHGRSLKSRNNTFLIVKWRFPLSLLTMDEVKCTLDTAQYILFSVSIRLACFIVSREI